MKTNLLLANYNQEKSLKSIFDFKGIVASIAEKSMINIDVKTDNTVDAQQRLHYFAIGHTFKNIETELIFDKVLDEDAQKMIPTKFLSLQEKNFDIHPDIKTLVYDIRNINSHYVHELEKIKLDHINPNVIRFIKESFEFAVLQVLLSEKEISYKDFIGKSNPEKEFVDFLHDKFYTLNNPKKNLNSSDLKNLNARELEQQKKQNEYKSIRNNFKALSKDEAIEALLLVDVYEDFDWKLFDSHTIFKITSGKYLSFYACLFLLTMFLYKSEANQLISKIKGFKLNDDKKFRSKKNIFSFFSKKLTSQDINSEEKNLVIFRDIIQYLNRYPITWNKEIELEAKLPLMTNLLKKEIIDMEIKRSYPDFSCNDRFLVFAKYQIWGKKYLGDSVKKEYIKMSFTDKEIDDFNYEINVCPELKGAHEKLLKLESSRKRNEKEINKTIQNIRELESKNNPNPITEKLRTRIEKNLLFVSYGRNQDRFMDFATRYLAENNYFGAEAEFKAYRFFTTDEQNNELEKLQETLTKKEFDKLKYHQGKLVHFTTFQNHLNRFPGWDTPFVIENNAIQVKLNLVNGNQKIVSIQRGLMVFLLEHSLYSDKIENIGKEMLQKYYFEHQKEFDKSKLLLSQQNYITQDEKTAFKKILPKRLLHNYLPALTNNQENVNTLKLLLDKAQKSEDRYKNLLNKAKNEGNYDDFIKRNKGKQFKLQFIRKAWHWMYFKQSYQEQIAFSGEHHKRYHITKEEFNDFSRFIFAFDEVANYKDYLNDMLYNKGFFDNNEFKIIFESCGSLDQLYDKTKRKYEEWLKKEEPIRNIEGKYLLENYEHFFDDQMFYINITHFIAFLKNKNYLTQNFEYKSSENKKYLIGAYYYKNTLEKSEYKTHGKLYNKLKEVKLEDCLLYEMALQYLNKDKTVCQTTRTNIVEIMTQNVVFDIKDKNNNHLYKLEVPFKKIDNYTGLIRHKVWKEGRFDGSFLSDIVVYLEKVKNHKDVKSVYQDFTKNMFDKVLSLDGLTKIEGHIISNSVKFTNLALHMEAYFIFKDKIVILKKNRIECSEIKKLELFFDSKTRNKAFHFEIPARSYEDVIKEIERKFVSDEVGKEQLTSYSKLSKSSKMVCNVFLQSIHNDYYDSKEKDSKKKTKDAEEKYFLNIINN